jgi:nitroimidazol reductase NimA-like FMN-containing flavoprotein (pyridoxamine 5'-phosphate oxidase superfamily)
MKETWYPSHLRSLSLAECLDLMAGTSVGRVAWCDEDGPVVVPVNFVLDNGSVVFRTSAHSTMAQRLRHGPASFQVDEYDDYTQSGWSVLVRGQARFVEPGDLPASVERPEPWAEGIRTFLIRITPDEITGRRLIPA